VDKSKNAVKKNLEDLGYFKYVAPDNLESIKEITFRDYQNDGIIQFPWEDGLNRMFGIDAEFIFEAEGIKSQIEGMLELFNELGIKLTIGRYVEDFDISSESYSTRIIELNEIPYDTSGSSDWNSAFLSGVKLINEILVHYGKEDRVYGLVMDESSWMILLDKALYEYLNDLIPEWANIRPIDISELDWLQQ